MLNKALSVWIIKKDEGVSMLLMPSLYACEIGFAISDQVSSMNDFGKLLSL